MARSKEATLPSYADRENKGNNTKFIGEKLYVNGQPYKPTKLSNPEFIEHINTYDIVVLSEAWLSPQSNYYLNINGYEAFHLYGNKSPIVRKGRYNGGISVYYKLELKNKLQIEEKQQSGIIWLKLCNSLFSFDSGVFLCNVYIPPRESRSVNQQENGLYEQIEWGIERYKLRGKVFVRGDWNARTSIEPDFIVFDKYLDNNSAVEPFFRDSDRVNKDHVLDTHRKRNIGGVCALTIETIVALPTVSVPPQ